MYAVAQSKGLVVGIFFNGHECGIDTTDGYLAESPSFTEGTNLVIKLVTKEGVKGGFLDDSTTKKGNRMVAFSSRTKRKKVVRILEHTIPLVRTKKGKLRAAPYPRNIITVVLRDASDMHFFEIGIVAQRGNFFLQSTEMNLPLLYENIDREVESRKKLGLPEIGDPTAHLLHDGPIPLGDAINGPPEEDPLPDLEADEENYALVHKYSSLTGDGILWMQPPRPGEAPVTAHVHWSTIRGKDRFKHLKEGWTIAYHEKVALPLKKGRPDWQVKGVRILLRHGDSLTT